MSDPSSNRRVAKNTLLLYIRMFITMAIGIWTSRIVLNALGFTDQGLYNVVGGFVGLSGLITASIGGSISRFVTFAIGSGDLEKANKAIQNAISVQWFLAIIILLVAETIGLWFLNNRLVIPPDRITAVNIIYQLSIGGLVVSLVSSAPNALIIAYERMGVYAAIAIVSSVLSLGIAISISLFGGDRLILYATLQFVTALCIRIFYMAYCRRSFPNLELKFGFDKEIFKPIFSFAGWNSIGTTASVLRGSGTGILLNIFGGPVANTINGIANSVNNLATVFVSDFTTAYTPQITKKYAGGEYSELIAFVQQCSKFSFILLSVMAVPIFVNVEPLLVLWLKRIPDGTVIFARLIIVYSLIETFSAPLIRAKNATGSIRNYQIVVGGILLMTIPLTYIFLKSGLPIYYSYVSILITSAFAFLARIIMLRGSLPGWSSYIFVRRVVVRCIVATVFALPLSIVLNKILPTSILWVLIQCGVGFVWSCVCMYLIACEGYERQALMGIISGFFKKIKLNVK